MHVEYQYPPMFFVLYDTQICTMTVHCTESESSDGIISTHDSQAVTTYSHSYLTGTSILQSQQGSVRGPAGDLVHMTITYNQTKINQ